MPENGIASVAPAQLSFLAIYNPLLGPTDETINDQIVFYTSRSSRLRRIEGSHTGDDVKQSIDEGNERLRQIGLAQGMVNFARNFSQGKAVDYVETEKSRIVLHELEKDWWIVASIDLTRLPSEASGAATSQSGAPNTPSFQYSSREICPPQLLLQHLLRAYSAFLLLHDFTLDDFYRRVGRPIFCNLLGRFWERFAWNWDILLSGNPAVDMFNGIKLAAGGELGIGVGEEEWGSGERAVLEDLVTRTDGLVDLVVSRFGDAPTHVEDSMSSRRANDPANTLNDEWRWLGSELHPRPSDGVIFTGVGAVSRSSLVRVSQWMEWIYRFGDDAYGVGEDPSSTRRRKHRKRRGRLFSRDTNVPPPASSAESTADADRPFSPGIPRPLVAGTSQPPHDRYHARSSSRVSTKSTSTVSERWSDWTGVFGTDTVVKYLTLGYGSPWSLWSQTPTTHPRLSALKQEDGTQNEAKQEASSTEPETTTEGDASTTTGDQAKIETRALGRFIIGLREDMQSQSLKESNSISNLKAGPSARIVLRTLHIRLAASSKSDERTNGNPAPLTSATKESGGTNQTGRKKLQAVIYVNQPFIFTFLFSPETPSLTDPSLYNTIRHELFPLQKPLLTSTSPANAAMRISMSEGQEREQRGDVLDSSRKRFSTKSHPVYDLVYDPFNLTIRSSIPNIPLLGSIPTTISTSTSMTSGSSIAESASGPNTNPPWSRVESVNVHHRLLNAYIETRSHPLEMERTYKTSRGWWVVWVRVLDSSTTTTNISHGDRGHAHAHAYAHQEAFLIRKASDYVSPSQQYSRAGSGARFFRDLGGAASSSASGLQTSRADMGPGKLAEGLGLDARRYIESLLSLNR